MQHPSHICLALSRANAPMSPRTGKFFAEFEIVSGDATIGVATCGNSMWGVSRWVFWGVDVATGEASRNDQFEPIWGTRRRRSCSPDGPSWPRFVPGDVLGALLDTGAACSAHNPYSGATLTMYRNGARIGVATGQLGGVRCWAVKLNSASSSVRIAGRRAPELSPAERAQETGELQAIEDEIMQRSRHARDSGPG
jgi:hypothetical protein